MTDLEKRLVAYIEDADGLEQHMLCALDELIETTNDPEIRDVLMHHQEQTDHHRQRLAERLAAHDATPSTVKDAGQIFVALTKEIIDRARPGWGGKIFSDGFVAEHLEITSYELLERVAKDAHDFQTAEVARRNRADEEAMVAELRAGWDQRLQA
jgi:ferritin-like metal-binding protein YciE